MVRLNRHLIGLACVLGIVSAAPARADNGELTRAILGIAGVAALAAIIDDQNNDRVREPVRQTSRNAVTPRVDNRGKLANMYRPCLRQQWTKKGWQTYLSQACVSRVNAKRSVDDVQTVNRRGGPPQWSNGWKNGRGNPWRGRYANN